MKERIDASAHFSGFRAVLQDFAVCMDNTYGKI